MKELLSSIGQINFELKALMFGDKTPPARAALGDGVRELPLGGCGAQGPTSCFIPQNSTL